VFIVGESVNYLEHAVLFIISFLANTFSSFSGGGAGLIQFLVLIFLDLSFSVALATHKVASVALGVGAALRYLTDVTHPNDISIKIVGYENT
jgi:uncharacterized membrane protein YfcA